MKTRIAVMACMFDFTLYPAGKRGSGASPQVRFAGPGHRGIPIPPELRGTDEVIR